MSDILQKIKACKTMNEIDDLRVEVIHEKTQESLTLWQKKYRGMKCFRKPADKGYRYSFDKRIEDSKQLVS